ncbi:MAG: tetrathionate reductase family octaheme c-type cytochrome [Gammaproteobacteria bacterium]|nr:tetrathionate reductase family octaheme c-type cytochrome [Gammaproteobacteria bacterium]
MKLLHTQFTAWVMAIALAGLVGPQAWASSKPVEAAAQPAATKPAEKPVADAKAEAKKDSKSTADHSKFKELKKSFKDGPEVTKACISCHTEAAKQVHATKHWNWEFINPQTKQKLGKKHVINNFCTSVKTNQTFCSACHVGYGWKDDSFNFAKQENVDCLVCHDTTGSYKKIPGLAGHPNYKRMEWPPHSGKFRDAVDLKKVAQNVGKTSRDTCGACHFYGGGGNGVKHGDLDSTLSEPSKSLDVHMDKDGLNFTCGKCHLSDAHEVSGSRYAPTAADDKGFLKRGAKDDRNPTTCQACHGTEPHDGVEPKLNDHTDRIACQTCHIPAFARGALHTKMSWDWSTAGKLGKNGERIQIKGAEGRDLYDSKKGHFTYERYVIPEYKWFNGDVKYTLFGDKVDGSKKVKISEFMGSADDPASRIWPVKVFTGKQPFDVGNQTLAVFHTAGKDEAAFWGNYDWKKSLEAGMAATGIPFSGKYDFVETESVWPITHMVAPKDDALTCAQCHKKNGRLEAVTGIYIPGRDSNAVIDFIGWSLALLTLIGVLIHGGIRIIMSRKG